MSKSLDIHQSLNILELDSLTTPAELKRAYRDLVHVWHPDRFQNNPRLQQRAEKRLREINLAYRHILAHLASNQPNTALTATELNRNAHIPTDKKKLPKGETAGRPTIFLQRTRMPAGVIPAAFTAQQPAESRCDPLRVDLFFSVFSCFFSQFQGPLFTLY